MEVVPSNGYCFAFKGKFSAGINNLDWMGTKYYYKIIVAQPPLWRLYSEILTK
jgi:hypothetical protein